MDVLLFLSMTSVVVTGLLIAKTLPTAVVGAYWLKPWHYFFAALSLGLSGVHLGLHAALLRGALWSKLPMSGRTRRVAGALLLCVVLCFGTYSLVRTEFLAQLSQPVVVISMSSGEGQRPLPGEAAQHNGEGRPGGGKGKGQGKGLGKGNGKNVGHEGAGAVSRVIQTVASYASILLWFAAVTAMLESVIRRRGKWHLPFVGE